MKVDVKVKTRKGWQSMSLDRTIREGYVVIENSELLPAPFHNSVVAIRRDTGCLDSTGTPIYEGDIIENNDVMMVVSWVEGAGKFVKHPNLIKRPLTDRELSQASDMNHMRKWTVAGNVYEAGDELLAQLEEEL